MRQGRLAQLGEHLPYKQGVTGSSPVTPTKYGPVVQLVRMPACHAGGRRFEPDPDRQFLNKMSEGHQATNYIPAHRAEGLCGGYSQVVKTAGCGSVMRGFESHYPPQKVMGYRQAVRQRILIPSCAGSNPATLANQGRV